MISTLEFELPDENEALQLALQGEDWREVCRDLDNLLGSYIKHGGIPDVIHVGSLEFIREKLHEIIEDKYLRLWG